MSDFIEFISDVEQGGAPVSADVLAPDCDGTTESGFVYDETKDPEMIRESYLANMQRRLQEAKRGDLVNAYANNVENPTYEGFMKSEWAHPNCTKEQFDKDISWLTNKGYIGTGKQFSTLGKSYGAGGSSKEKKAIGPYERDENYEAGEYSKQAEGLFSKYGEASLKGSAEETFQDIYNVVKNIILKKTDKTHAIIYGDPGIGKTFEVMEVCKRYMPQSPSKAKYVYEAGDIGSAMSSLVPFFYYHSNNKVIVLDDNDKMIMKGLEQSILNIMKAIMDPKAAKEKPITVRGTLMKAFQNQYDDLVSADAEALKEGVWIEVDTEALKENRFVVAVDDEIVVDNYISLRESQNLQNRIIDNTDENYTKSWDYLREGKMGTNKELLDDLIGSDEDEDEYAGYTKEDIKAMKSMKDSGATESFGEGESFPRRFLFNSSIIFISNLEMDDINSAVLDRTESVEVKLSLDQYLERLGKIYSNLAKIGDSSLVDPKVRKWSRECVYTLIGIAIECWKANRPVFGKPVEINRKLTFRMFDEFVSAWERYAMDRCERVYGKDLNVDDKALMTKISNDLIPEMMRRKVIPWLKTVVRI